MYSYVYRGLSTVRWMIWRYKAIWLAWQRIQDSGYAACTVHIWQDCKIFGYAVHMYCTRTHLTKITRFLDVLYIQYVLYWTHLTKIARFPNMLRELYTIYKDYKNSGYAASIVYTGHSCTHLTKMTRFLDMLLALYALQRSHDFRICCTDVLYTLEQR